MKNINWGANFNLPYARYYSKYLVDGKEYNQTLNEFKYSNIINPNNSISIGNTCSSSVTFSIFQPQITLENKDITIFEGVKGDSGIEYVQIGIFTVTKEESNGEYTKYTAYDKMYKAEKGYFSELTYPSTDKAILEEICTKLGIQLATSITNTHTITDKPQGYTMREMIGYMATLQGGNAAINSDGNLEIKWYKDSGYVLDGHQYYQQGVTFTTSKDFTIRKLTCNNTKSGDKETSTITSGSGATGLSFANPFMTQAILDEVYKKIGGFQFRPLTVKFVGDWRLEVGDIITVNKDGVDYKVPIMQITHECDGGLMDTVTSIGQSDTENSNIASGPMTKQMERYYADLVLINKAVIENADITNANIESLKAHQAYIDQLKTNKIETVTADIVNLTASKATINEANIAKLQADYAQIGVLNADVADIKTLMFGSATGKSLTTGFANAVVSVIGNAQIKDAMIDSIAASKITALDLNTTKFKVHSENGLSYWQDNTIIIKDTDRIRVQIGKDANSDYNMYVWDKAGNLMFDALGLTEKGVTRKVVRDEVVKDDANINASKLDIETLFNVINNDSTHTLKSNKIYLDNEKQTLNVIMQAITSGAGKDYTQWGGMMKVASDFITNKLWWTENVDNESIKTKFSAVNQKLDSYEITLSDLYQQTNDNFMVYTVTATPTKDNYPAVDWFIPIYPSDDLFPDDNLTWTYSNDEYAKHHGAIAYNETAQKTWRWVKDDKGNWGWKEVSNTQLAYMLNQNASLKINLNSISTELTQTKKNLTDNYSTTTQMNNAITQAVNAESNSIKSEISTTYVTKNTLTGYSTTEAMNNAITQAITKESNSIKLEVSSTYATKKSLESYATNDSLKSYATKASLEAYIKKDPATGELKSAIEAIADTINITARGGLNLSGNRFMLNSTNTSITADGTITCKNFVGNGGTIGGWNINSTSIYSDYRYDPSVGYGLYRVSLDKSTGSDSKVMSVRATVKDNVFSYPFYVRSDGYLYTVKGQISGFQFDSNKMSNTVSIYLLPDKDVLHTLRNAIVNNTTSQLALSQYDLNGSGKVDLTDFVVAKNYVLGTQTEADFRKWKYAKTSDITYKLNPSDVKNALSISGSDIWGKTRQTTLGIGTLYSNEISCDNLIVKDPVDYSTFNTFLNTINVKETSTSIDLENFVRNYTIKGNGMLVVNISIWTDVRDDYGTTTAKIYIDGNCVMNNRNRLANSHPSELAGGATFVWWFNDNATHRIKLEAGSSKEGTKTYTQSIQALFGLQIST
jgi:hypothetical protein